MIVTVAIALIGFVVFVAVHIAGLRWGRDNGLWLPQSYGVCLVATLATIAAVLTLWPSREGAFLQLFIGALASACLFVFYVPALYVVLTSISVETIVLLTRNNGSMVDEDLYARFASERVAVERLRVLAHNGYLADDRGGFSLTAKGRGVARTFAFVKRLWVLGPGG